MNDLNSKFLNAENVHIPVLMKRWGDYHAFPCLALWLFHTFRVIASAIWPKKKGKHWGSASRLCVWLCMWAKDTFVADFLPAAFFFFSFFSGSILIGSAGIPSFVNGLNQFHCIRVYAPNLPNAVRHRRYTCAQTHLARDMRRTDTHTIVALFGNLVLLVVFIFKSFSHCLPVNKHRRKRTLITYSHICAFALWPRTRPHTHTHQPYTIPPYREEHLLYSIHTIPLAPLPWCTFHQIKIPRRIDSLYTHAHTHLYPRTRTHSKHSMYASKN